MPSRLALAALAFAVLPLSGCNPDEATALAHAAGSDLHVKISNDQADSILEDLTHRNPGLTKSEILDQFKKNAERAGEIINEIGERAACAAVEYRLKAGSWPETDAAKQLQQQVSSTSIGIDTLVAVCRAKELGESGF